MELCIGELMSIDTQPFCPTCTQQIGGIGLLKAEIDGLKSLHTRELELRLATEKVRDELIEQLNDQVKVSVTLQEALDTAEEDLMVLGQKLLAQAKGSMKL
jgi:hypothetical protein